METLSITDAIARSVTVSIAGSDSSGGAGIQMDLRVFSALGTYGCTVLTALTAQNPKEVNAVEGMSQDFVRQQADAVFTYFSVGAFKTGMLWSKEIIDLAADIVAKNPQIPSVVDPVMIASSGAKLVSDDAINSYRENLLPKCTIMTPNLDEAQVLLDGKNIDRKTQEDAARELGEKYGCAVLLKGGHLEGDPCDILYLDSQIYRWTHRRLQDINTHGSGCLLSAAITSNLAKGRPLKSAVEESLKFLRKAIANPITPRPELALAGIERT